ncbi:alpha/beta fold hydrolase [Flavobacteriaceae bacterium F08102]|nr:alpha/beta fold hydrolase [Flavobacteriaceae bacterium F08102]
MKKFILVAFLGLTISISAKQANKVHFNTKDGIKIAATYQLPQLSSGKIPAVILIHQGGSNRNEWKSLPIWNNLIKAGYAILAYDIRQHGESEKDQGDMNDLFNNPNRAPLDVLAAISFLTKDTRIDSQRIGIIGASIGANLACVAASSNAYQVKTVVALSPKTTAAQNLSGKNQPIKLKNALFIASEKEQNGMRKKWAKQLYEMTSGNRLVGISPGNLHGSFILKEDSKMNTVVEEWIKNTL